MATVLDIEMATCSKCGESKPLDEFNRNRAHPNGRDNWCRSCMLERGREHYQRPEVRERQREYEQRAEVKERKRERERKYCAEGRYRERKREYRRERMAPNRAYLNELKSAPCIDCGGDFPPEQMHFHHRDPATKAGNVGAMTMCRRATLDAEIAKCDFPLCNSCHQKRHTEQDKTLSEAAASTETLAEASGLKPTGERSLLETASTH